MVSQFKRFILTLLWLLLRLYIYQSIAKRATAGLTDKEAENLAVLEKQLADVSKLAYAKPQEKPKQSEDKPFEL